MKSSKDMGEWKEYKLGDLCTKIGSGATPRGGKESYLGGNIALIRSQNVLDFDFSNIGLVFINEEQADKLKNVVVDKDDVLLNITGDSVARVCIVPKWVLPARVNQHVSIIRSDKSKADSHFLLYYLQFKKQSLLSISKGGGTRNALTKKMLEDLDIKLPTLPIQQKIASILSSLDDKIECNRKINENLEQQAQALFKSWFVDFEPFKDGKFVESELGMIPEGWKIGLLEDLITIKYGKDHKKLNDGNIPIYGSGGIMRYVDTAIYDKESVLIPRKGTLNNVILVNEPFWSVDTMFYSVMKEPNIAKFVYLFLKRKDLSAMNNGSAVPSMTTNILNNLAVILPPQKVLSAFEEIVRSIWNHYISCEQQISSLIQFRDTLLPKLMSGEIKI